MNAKSLFLEYDNTTQVDGSCMLNGFGLCLKPMKHRSLSFPYTD